MKCIEIHNQKLILVEDRPMPKIKSGEVLVKVYAAGVNRPDLLQRKGLYPPPEGATDIPGLEIAGEIVKGSGKGRRVCALTNGGGYAEYCAVPSSQCLPIPKGMDFVTAAGIPETFFTVWANLFGDKEYAGGGLKKGETLLIHGGASGIGTTAIQIARAIGAKIFITAGNDEKCLACKTLGAHHTINYNKEDFVEKILDLTKGKGVDVILDMVGGNYVPRNIKILKTGGRHISIAVQNGRTTTIDIFQIMQKRAILTGSTLRSRSTKEKAAIAAALLENIWPRMHKKRGIFALLSKKRISPVIDKIFPLTLAQEAHDYLEAGKNIGKVIIKTDF